MLWVSKARVKPVFVLVEDVEVTLRRLGRGSAAQCVCILNPHILSQTNWTRYCSIIFINSGFKVSCYFELHALPSLSLSPARPPPPMISAPR